MWDPEVTAPVGVKNKSTSAVSSSADSRQAESTRTCQQVDSDCDGIRQPSSSRGSDDQASPHAESDGFAQPRPFKRHWDRSAVYHWRKPRSKSAKHTPNSLTKGKSPVENCTTCEYIDSICTTRRTEKDVVPPLNLGRILNSDLLEPEETASKKLDTIIKSSSKISDLPDELLLMIFAKLPKLQLPAVMLVCHKFYRIANDAHLWKEIVLHKRTLDDRIIMGVASRRPETIKMLHCDGKLTIQGLCKAFSVVGQMLKKMILDTCNFGAHCGDVILSCMASFCPCLSCITIRWTQVSDHGLISLSEKCQRISSLHIDQAPGVSMQSIKQLALKHGKWLETLGLCGKYNIPSPCARKILAVCGLHLMQLVAFEASYYNMELCDVKAICALSCLRRFKFTCFKVSEEALVYLFKMKLHLLSCSTLVPLKSEIITSLSSFNTVRQLSHFNTQNGFSMTVFFNKH